MRQRQQTNAPGDAPMKEWSRWRNSLQSDTENWEWGCRTMSCTLFGLHSHAYSPMLWQQTWTVMILDGKLTWWDLWKAMLDQWNILVSTWMLLFFHFSFSAKGESCINFWFCPPQLGPELASLKPLLRGQSGATQSNCYINSQLWKDLTKELACLMTENLVHSNKNSL